MANENQVTLVGNLTRDLELSFTQGGRAVAKGSLAVNRRYQQDGEWKDDATYLNIVLWGELGENMAQSTGKGSRIWVQGRIASRSYEDNEGVTKYVTEVVVDEAGPSLRWATCEITRIERTNNRD